MLDALRAIAPVTAIRGNNDRGEWARSLPESRRSKSPARWLYVLHDLHELDLDPAAAGFAAVIAGHSHRPLIEERQGVLFVNPGSAGPRRFTLPVAVARLRIAAGRVAAERSCWLVAAGSGCRSRAFGDRIADRSAASNCGFRRAGMSRARSRPSAERRGRRSWLTDPAECAIAG